ncbi:MAG: cytochrome c family protein [Deltaproteobacteria bacterium]|nr:cytochrome c family protein [Candidatus Zymogenaceae bacterium]
MKSKADIVTLCTLFVCIAVAAAFTYNKEYKFEGASHCAVCHSSSDIGDQYGIWKTSPHSGAYESLFSEESLEYAEEREMADPSKNEQCLTCHLTGYDASFELMGPLYRRDDGVSCEGCHGSGGGYAYFSIMMDRELAVKKGLVASPENTCVSCHSGECPFDVPFEFEPFMERIEHPRPD